jgi:hypothetical protein
MRWIRAMAALACAGVLACGGGGEDAGPSGAAGEDGGASPAEAAGDPSGSGGDPGACPPVGEMQDATGHTIDVADNTASDPTYSLVCIYGTREVEVGYYIYCQDHGTPDEARATIANARSDPAASPYDVGEEAVIVNNNVLEEDAPLRVLSEMAFVRSGSQVCEVQYQVHDPDSTEPPDGVVESLRYLATTTAAT